MRINGRINAQEVRLISSSANKLELYQHQALEIARNEDLDLVELVANQSPPVCRIMDLANINLNNLKKRMQLKKQKQIQVKIKFRPGTEEADYQVKLKNLVKFLQAGDKAKITMRFRGREAASSNRSRIPRESREGFRGIWGYRAKTRF